MRSSRASNESSRWSRARTIRSVGPAEATGLPGSASEKMHSYGNGTAGDLSLHPGVFDSISRRSPRGRVVTVQSQSGARQLVVPCLGAVVLWVYTRASARRPRLEPVEIRNDGRPHPVRSRSRHQRSQFPIVEKVGAVGRRARSEGAGARGIPRRDGAGRVAATGAGDVRAETAPHQVGR